jgi:hypothetical protein
MKRTVEYVKNRISSNIETVHYFSDGCAGQYKNCRNFINICHHKQDFGVNCTWSFFATSHGKSPCDGIGGTVERLTANASLYRTSKNQILTTPAMLEFCENEIKGIHFIYITKESNIKIRSEMVQRYTNAKTLPGTRSYHHFVPLRTTKIAAKIDSEQEENSRRRSIYKCQHCGICLLDV